MNYSKYRIVYNDDGMAWHAIQYFRKVRVVVISCIDQLLKFYHCLIRVAVGMFLTLLLGTN